MATMGTLSAFLTISAKSWSSMDTRDEQRAQDQPAPSPTRFVQKARRGTAKKNRTAASEMKMARGRSGG